MSTRTIIEINHDYLSDIVNDHVKLCDFIKRLGNGLDWAEQSKPYGIRVLGQRHHSETLKLVVK